MNELIGPKSVPKGALTWRSPEERRQALAEWRKGVVKAFPRDCRVIRVAWALRELMEGGYCYASNRYIGEQAGVPTARVSDALTELERAGAIVRGVVLDGPKSERRVWPSAQICAVGIPRDGGGGIPRHGGKTSPVTGDQNNNYKRARNHSPLGASTALSNAALDAELRRRREAGQPMPWNEGLPALTD